MIRIGSCTLGERPRVVAAVSDGVPRRDAEVLLASGVDILELRIDTFSRCDTDHVVAEAVRQAGLPLLGTIRCAAEGGAWKGTEADRLALFRAVLPHVGAVDIELSSSEILGDVVAGARAAGSALIGSHHNFGETPSDAELDAVVESGAGAGVDIVKVAARCNDNGDLRRLAAFTLRHADRAMVVIGMGPAGMLSRVFFPALGSLLTYTFLGAPSAPGQLNSEDTVKYLRFFYGYLDEGGS
jgi:3-dehydroquinate dehydratase-1